MAGDGSDQRALQYEQTLVSLTCCRSELCSLVTQYVQSSCMEREARLHSQISQLNAACLVS